MAMSEYIRNGRDCCGCSACSAICPVKSISMLSDPEGFLCSVFSGEECLSCGLCEKVCPVKHQPERRFAAGLYGKYAIKIKDDKVRSKSTSGGVFTSISDTILLENGVIYCTVFDDEFNVTYQRIKTSEGRDKARGAKYVQSDMKNSLQDIHKDLKQNRTVLFIGSPCYVDGLHRFLCQKNDVSVEQLITVDMVCHGVPSPRIWHDNVALLKEKYGNLMSDYKFRDKEIGWRGAQNSAVFDDKKVSQTRLIQAYTSLYFNGFITRPICHKCQYTNLNRIGDISIGDCWGIEKDHSDFDDGKGISLVMVNTEKGKEIFEKIRNVCDVLNLGTDECIQSQLREPSVVSRNRKDFWNYYLKNGYEKTVKKYTTYGTVKQMKSLIKKLFGK